MLGAIISTASIYFYTLANNTNNNSNNSNNSNMNFVQKNNNNISNTLLIALIIEVTIFIAFVSTVIICKNVQKQI